MGDSDWERNRATSVTQKQIHYFVPFDSALNKRVSSFRHLREKDLDWNQAERLRLAF